MAQKQNVGQKKVALSVNLDSTPVLYTDRIFMSINEDGLVLDVCQKLGPTNQLRIVSRIGMSKTHTEKFLRELGKLVLMTKGQKQTGDVKAN